MSSLAVKTVVEMVVLCKVAAWSTTEIHAHDFSPFPLLMSFQIARPIPWTRVTFRNKLFLYGGELWTFAQTSR
jgi:hypothetical protein